MVGIAVDTFYNYYSSKENLFLDIYQGENVMLKQSIMNSNPILWEWYNRDVFSKIEQQYREENGVVKYDFEYNSFAEVISMLNLHFENATICGGV